jgi:hypothetical protein
MMRAIRERPRERAVEPKRRWGSGPRIWGWHGELEETEKLLKELRRALSA